MSVRRKRIKNLPTLHPPPISSNVVLDTQKSLDVNFSIKFMVAKNKGIFKKVFLYTMVLEVLEL